MRLSDRFVDNQSPRSAHFRAPTQAEAARWRLPAALALSLLALLVVLVGARGGLSVVLIGAFMLAVPGLLGSRLSRSQPAA